MLLLNLFSNETDYFIIFLLLKICKGLDDDLLEILKRGFADWKMSRGK